MFLMLLNTKLGVVQLLCSRSMGMEGSCMKIISFISLHFIIARTAEEQAVQCPLEMREVSSREHNWCNQCPSLLPGRALSNLDLLTWSPGLFLWWIFILTFVSWLSVGIHCIECRCSAHFVHYSSPWPELMGDTGYIFVELINHELVNVGMKSSFVGWNGEARHLGIW